MNKKATPENRNRATLKSYLLIAPQKGSE